MLRLRDLRYEMFYLLVNTERFFQLELGRTKKKQLMVGGSSLSRAKCLGCPSCDSLLCFYFCCLRKGHCAETSRISHFHFHSYFQSTINSGYYCRAASRYISSPGK